MTQFNYADAKVQIEEITKIVETCPEPLREKCFELLFGVVFGKVQNSFSASIPVKTPKAPEDLSDVSTKRSPSGVDYKLPSNILAFTRKYDVSFETIQKLFILDHEPLLPIYKITTKVTATAQLQKVMMILLENGLLNNQMKAPYTELRDSIKEAGLMDGNFNKMLKKNSALFRGAVTKDKITETEMIELTGAGYERLSQIVKELTQPAS
ncbi:MAG TPA: hypothetical protein VNH44_00305 [Micropepsaceae bacterium]|nr:hypothetical protein [Micropepsaceae bacterium]